MALAHHSGVRGHWLWEVYVRAHVDLVVRDRGGLVQVSKMLQGVLALLRLLLSVVVGHGLLKLALRTWLVVLLPLLLLLLRTIVHCTSLTGMRGNG